MAQKNQLLVIFVSFNEVFFILLLPVESKTLTFCQIMIQSTLKSFLWIPKSPSPGKLDLLAMAIWICNLNLKARALFGLFPRFMNCIGNSRFKPICMFPYYFLVRTYQIWSQGMCIVWSEYTEFLQLPVVPCETVGRTLYSCRQSTLLLFVSEDQHGLDQNAI